MLFPTPSIPDRRNPRLNPPWSACGDLKDPDFGHLWAERGLGEATVLYFDRARTQHCMTEFRHLHEGEVVEWANRDWIVTWAPGVAAAKAEAA